MCGLWAGTSIAGVDQHRLMHANFNDRALLSKSLGLAFPKFPAKSLILREMRASPRSAIPQSSVIIQVALRARMRPQLTTSVRSASGLSMHFTRVVSGIEEMEVWNARSDAASFVISYESRSGPGFHGQTGLGYAVSWRPVDQNHSAVSVPGSPFETLAEAREACNAMAAVLTKAGPIGARINFDVKAVLRKWPSLGNERRTGATGPYQIMDGTLDECLREFMAKPTSARHLYEIHTAPPPPLANAVLPEGVILEFARLRGFDRIT